MGIGGCIDFSKKTEDTCTGDWKQIINPMLKKLIKSNRKKLDFNVWIEELLNSDLPYFAKYNRTKKEFDKYKNGIRILPFKEQVNGVAEGKSSSFSINNDPDNIRKALTETSLYYHQREDYFKLFTNKEAIERNRDGIPINNNLDGFRINVTPNEDDRNEPTRIYEGVLTLYRPPDEYSPANRYKCIFDDGRDVIYDIYWDEDNYNFYAINHSRRERWHYRNKIVLINSGSSGNVEWLNDLRNYDGSLNSLENFFYFVGLMLGRLIVRNIRTDDRFITTFIPLGKFLNYLILNWNRRRYSIYGDEIDEMFHYVLLDNPNKTIRQIKAEIGFNIFTILNDNNFDNSDRTLIRIKREIEATYNGDLQNEDYINIVNLHFLDDTPLLINFILLTKYSQNPNNFEESKRYYNKFFDGISHFVKSDEKSLINPFALENTVFKCDLAKNKKQFLEKLSNVRVNGREQDKKIQAKQAFKQVVEQMELNDFKNLINYFTALDCLPSEFSLDILSLSNRVLEGHTCWNGLNIPYKGHGLKDTDRGDPDYYDTFQKMKIIVDNSLRMLSLLNN